MLRLHTDASIVGRRLPQGYIQKRTRVGHTFVAWAGWHDCDLPERPTFAGQAYVGEHGTQRAEFYAVLHGVSAALAYVRALVPDQRPGLVVAHIDNDPVYKIMTGEWKAAALRRHYEAACQLCAELLEDGVDMEWRSVSERHKRHRIVDSMSKQAQRQVLVRKDWRPPDDAPETAATPPPKVPDTPWDDDIPF